MVTPGLRKRNITRRSTCRDEKKWYHRKTGGGGKPVGKMAQEGAGGGWSCQTAPLHPDRKGMRGGVFVQEDGVVKDTYTWKRGLRACQGLKER